MATNWQSKMENGELRMGAIRWSNCSSTTQVSDLTYDYCDYVDDINNAGKAGGGTYVSEALIDAYDMLTASQTSNSKNIIIITDGAISDFNGTTSVGCEGTASTTLANQMKSGTYGSGIPIKIYTINIQNGSNAQLNSLSSGPGFHFFASSFNDFADNVADQVTSDPCQENPLTGDSYYYYTASPCCTDLSLDDIVIALETGITPSYSVDTFEWNGSCYTIESITANTFSGSSVYTVDSSEFTTCSDPRCDCSVLRTEYFRNCCNGGQTIEIVFSGSGTISENSGFEYSGACWWYDSSWGGSGAETVGLTITSDSLISNICDEGYCECIIDDCPEQDIIIAIAGTFNTVDGLYCNTKRCDRYSHDSTG